MSISRFVYGVGSLWVFLMQGLGFRNSGYIVKVMKAVKTSGFLRSGFFCLGFRVRCREEVGVIDIIKFPYWLCRAYG